MRNTLFFICENLGWDYYAPQKDPQSFKAKLHSMYFTQEMSAKEISEWLNENVTDKSLQISPRSVQRRVSIFFPGQTRSTGEAFQLAASRGRVNWKYKKDKIKRG